MEIRDRNIDGGKAFDWGRTSGDYAKYRDIYPDEFYKRITERGFCVSGQTVLDLGTGTGVLPRNMYKYGAKWIGADISPEQIEQARILSGDKDIEYIASPAEKLSFPDGTFDVITACQCFWYFDHKLLAPVFHRMLKDGGCIVPLYMAWLPGEDKIAGECEKLILRYSPGWTGGGETVHPIYISEDYNGLFDIEYHDEYYLDVPFTRESWNGRLKACRGIGASLEPEQIAEWEKENMALLEKIAPEKFTVRHYGAIAVLRKK